VAGPPLLGPLIASNSFSLMVETCPNGAVDPGETVTVSLGLRNSGLTDTTNLVATLQASGGVVSPTGPTSYGVLTAEGAAVSRLFTFSAGGTCGGTNIATLQLQDGTANMGTVTFPFRLGRFSDSVIFAENFDGVVSPALPAGWTVSSSGAGGPWATTTSAADTPPNSAFVHDPSSPSDNSLVSPPFLVTGPAAD
jgi:hypothetical protein